MSRIPTGGCVSRRSYIRSRIQSLGPGDAPILITPAELGFKSGETLRTQVAVSQACRYFLAGAFECNRTTAGVRVRRKE